jgi:hypothetical protein
LLLFAFGLGFLAKYFENIHHHRICFINYIYTWYNNVYTTLHTSMHAFIKVWTQTSWKCTKVFTTKPLQGFDKINRRFNFIIFSMKLFKKFKILNIFSFSKFIQMLQMKIWFWSLFNNLFMKIIIIYNYAIWRVQKKLKITCYE